MAARSSISRVPAERHLPNRIRQLAIVSFIIVFIVVSVTVLSFTKANELMRQPATPLETFSSNILPSFSPISFPSLDEQTRLFGWFFNAPTKPVSTIVLVHDQGRNRLQFGLDSAEMVQYLLNQGYNVLAFDLRHSGQSDGELSSYGYSEWADVLAAIRYARQHAVTRDVLLYGFGTGTAASLLAIDRLPPAGTVAAAAAGDSKAVDLLKSYPSQIRDLNFDQGYIRGLLLDTPCTSPDEYIRADSRDGGWKSGKLLQHVVPLAVRISSGNSGRSSAGMVTMLTRSQVPVFLAYSEQTTHVSQESVATIINERLRLHPDTTMTHVTDEPGYIANYLQDKAGYLEAVGRFLSRYFS